MLNRDPSLQHVLDSIAKQHEGMTKLECRMPKKMRNDTCKSLCGYDAPSYLPFNDLTVQRFNVAKP